MHQERIKKVLSAMEQQHLAQLVITDPASIFYLLGKWIHPGKRMLALYLNLEGNHKLFINELFPVFEDLGVEKVWFKDTDQPISLLAQHLMDENVVGIDKSWPAQFLLELMEQKPDCSYVNCSPIIDSIRAVKDLQEIEWMRQASRLNDQAMANIQKVISPKYTEKEMTQQLLEIYEQLGTQGPSFDPIIAYGANGADPHHSPDHAALKPGDSIIIDIGCKASSYCADMTRTVFYQSASEEAVKVYHIVKEANARAIAAVRPGVRFCDIDAAARSYIEEQGYGKYFTHRTGHSIGIEVHDFGDVSAVNTNPVVPGMIFSIEPGIYLPGKFGVRIEDLVMVTEDSCEVLNQFSKELKIIE